MAQHVPLILRRLLALRGGARVAPAPAHLPQRGFHASCEALLRRRSAAPGTLQIERSLSPQELEGRAEPRTAGTELLGTAGARGIAAQATEDTEESKEMRVSTEGLSASRYAGSEDLEDEFVPRVPRGSMNVGTVEAPDALRQAAERAITQSGLTRREVFEDAEKLAKFVTNRGFHDIKVPFGAQRPSLQFSPKQKYSPRLVYGAREALAYLVARQPHVYASTARVLHEIYMRDPHFQPKSILDFGSGVGSTVWAAHEIFGESIEEYNMVDSSLPMLALAEQLLTDPESNRRHIPHVHMRQYISPSPQIRHDLVVSAYTLCELPDQASRLKILETLWSKTRGMLVLVEDGSPDAFQMMLQARDFIIQLTQVEEQLAAENSSKTEEDSEPQKSGGVRGRRRLSRRPEISTAANESEEEASGDESRPAERAANEDTDSKRQKTQAGMHVFGPCPHEKTCPRFDDLRPCHFPQRAHFPQAQAFNKVLVKQAHDVEKFTYMIFSRGERRDEFSSWHRLLSAPKYYDSHAKVHMCHADGYELETTVSKRQGKKIWKDIRRREWGDLYPPAFVPPRE